MNGELELCLNQPIKLIIRSVGFFCGTLFALYNITLIFVKSKIVVYLQFVPATLNKFTVTAISSPCIGM